MSDDSQAFRSERGGALAGLLKTELGVSNLRAKRWIEEAKVFVNDRVQTKAGYRVVQGDLVELRTHAPKARAPGPRVKIVYADSQVVVVDKPEGVMSVPYAEGDRGTAMDLLRDEWRVSQALNPKRPLHVVHRIDKDTSGLLAFALTKRAERGLGLQLRAHTMHREYLCLVHGQCKSARYESQLVKNRGDGYRGSTTDRRRGKRALTHTTLVLGRPNASLLSVRLETGRTHQIRIHLAEANHPLVGERVYTRDFIAEGRRPIESERLMLHAFRLNFVHPQTEELVRVEAKVPESFRAQATALGFDLAAASLL